MSYKSFETNLFIDINKFVNRKISLEIHGITIEIILFLITGIYLLILLYPIESKNKSFNLILSFILSCVKLKI